MREATNIPSASRKNPVKNPRRFAAKKHTMPGAEINTTIGHAILLLSMSSAGKENNGLAFIFLKSIGYHEGQSCSMRIIEYREILGETAHELSTVRILFSKIITSFTTQI